MLSQIHYDQPISHSQKRTRFLIQANQKVIAESIKLLELKINPTMSVAGATCTFPVLVGAYGCISKLQVALDGRVVDVWTAQELLPYLIAMSGDNEKNFGLNSVLYGTGNNLELDQASGLLVFNRPVVDSQTVSLKLNVYSDLLKNINVINSKLEIIIDWEQSTKKWLIPSAGVVNSVNIDPPYISYETLNENVEQPKEVSFRQWERDQWIIPQIPTTDETNVLEGTVQKVEIRSNGFNNKVIGRMLLSTCPSNVATLTPGDENKDLFGLFAYYMSNSMYNEYYNISKNGRSLLTFRNINNDAVKHALSVDTWGEGCFATNGHLNSNTSVLKALPAGKLNSFCSYGCIEINDRVLQDIQFNYSRESPAQLAKTHALVGVLNISAIAEVECILKNGEKEYV
jgi:hypothetical protein